MQRSPSWNRSDLIRVFLVIKHPHRIVSPVVPLMAEATRARGIYSAPDHRLGERQLRLFRQDVETQETGNDPFKGTKHAGSKSVYLSTFRPKKAPVGGFG